MRRERLKVAESMPAELPEVAPLEAVMCDIREILDSAALMRGEKVMVLEWTKLRLFSAWEREESAADGEEWKS